MPDFSTSTLRRAANDALDTNPDVLTPDTPVAVPAPHRSHAPIHALLAAMAGGQVADGLTTRAAIDRGAGSESNPLYGPDPSLGRIFGTKAALMAPAAYGIDKVYDNHPKTSMVLAGLLTALGTGAAIHNARVGK